MISRGCARTNWIHALTCLIIVPRLLETSKRSPLSTSFSLYTYSLPSLIVVHRPTPFFRKFATRSPPPPKKKTTILGDNIWLFSQKPPNSLKLVHISIKFPIFSYIFQPSQLFPPPTLTTKIQENAPTSPIITPPPTITRFFPYKKLSERVRAKSFLTVS